MDSILVSDEIKTFEAQQPHHGAAQKTIAALTVRDFSLTSVHHEKRNRQPIQHVPAAVAPAATGRDVGRILVKNKRRPREKPATIPPPLRGKINNTILLLRNTYSNGNTASHKCNTNKLMKKQFVVIGSVLFLTAFSGDVVSAQDAGTNQISAVTNITHLPKVIVTGRQDSLLRIADSATRARPARRNLPTGPFCAAAKFWKPCRASSSRSTRAAGRRTSIFCAASIWITARISRCSSTICRSTCRRTRTARVIPT